MIIIRRIIAVIFMCILCICCCVPSFAISAESAYAVRTSDFSSYYDWNSNTKMPIASLTKIMTAVVVIEHCEDLNETVEISDEAVGVEGSSVYLRKGEALTVEELLWALLLSSANDASVALAIHIAGSVPAFVDLMNLKALALCMNDTVYMTPHGLPAEGQYSTAKDQALLTCYALGLGSFEKICSTYSHCIPLEGVENGRYLTNHNKLLKSYLGCIGVKTGYTKSAGRCLISCARRGDVVVLCVTLNAPSDWADHAEILDLGFKLWE